MFSANRIKLLVYLTAFVWLTFHASQSWSQGRGLQDIRKGAAAVGKQKPMPVSPQGKIEAIKIGLVKIGAATGDSWLVQIPRSAEIHVLGSAKPSFLRPGQYARFKVKIDKRGMAQEKVAQMTIFTPTKSSVLGLFPESGFSGGPDAAMESETATTKKKKGRSKGKKQPLQASTYEVNGQLGGVKRNGQWMINTPHGNITFELAEDIAISVDLANYSFAKLGDSISCSGLQNGERTATASSVEIELTEPLAGVEKKGKLSRRSKSSKSRKSKSDGDESEQDADNDGNDKEKADTEKNDAEQDEKLAKLLEPKGKYATGESLDLTIKGEKITFGASTQGPSLTLQKRFGRPKKTYAKGTVTAADGAAGTPSQWKVWIWGSVKVAIDKSGKARFYSYEK